MAISDVIKKGTTAPVAGDLIEGGIGIDVTNKVMYSKGADGNIFEVTQADVSKLGIDGLVGDYRAVGLSIFPDISLITEIGTGEAYIGSKAVVITTPISNTYTASKDTYVDMDSSGAVTYTEVANGAGEPTLVGGWFRLAKVVTDVDNVTSVDERNLPFTLVGRDVVADGTKLDGIEVLSDVTDATNVAAAGAVMESDTSTVSMAFVDGDTTLAADSTTKVPTQNAVKTYVGNAIASTVDYIGGYDAATNTPNLDDVGNITVDKGDMYTVTAAGNFFAAVVSVGDSLIAQVANANEETEWTIVNSNLDATSIKTLYESNTDTNEFTDAEKASLGTMADNANAYVHPDHTGDVTSTADGATIITNGAVNLTKIEDIVQDSFVGRNTAGTGAPQNLTAAQARTVLDVDTSAEVDTKIGLETAGNVANINDLEAKVDEHRKLGRKNYIINGNFDIWQRGTSHSADGYGSVDRWLLGTGGSDLALVRSAVVANDATWPSRPDYVAHLTKTTAFAGGISFFETRVEDPRRFNERTVTVSFDADISGLTGALSTDITAILNGVNAFDGAGITLANTTGAEKFSYTVVLPDFVNGETLTDSDYLTVRLIGDATTSWTTLKISGVQLEVGSVATDFEYRPIGEELALCQRYFEIVTGQISGGAFSAGALVFSGKFVTTKRTLPTITTVAAGNYVGNGAVLAVTSSTYLSEVSVDSYGVDSTSFVGVPVVGYSYELRNFIHAVEAEL